MVAAAKPPARSPQRQRGAHCVLVDTSRSIPFDIIDAKITVPEVPSGSVSRTALVNRLRARTATRVVALIAPAGYGKTTTLAQWATRDDRPFLWVSADAHDNDAVVLLRHLAAALDRVSPVEERVFDALRCPGASLWTTAVPRLARAASELDEPVVLVLDDAHLIRDADAADAVYAVAEQLPLGSVFALAARATPLLSLPSLRAQGRLLDIDPDDLALTRREAELLMRAAGLDIEHDELDELTRKTEGWPAALSLVALSLVESMHRDRDAMPAITGDRHVADYLAAEYFSGLSAGELDFMRKTAILDRVCGSLCDAALGITGSGNRLASIERANHFLRPLDGGREWYRYHRLLRDILRQDLVRSEPAAISELHARAADWFEANGDDESALEHANDAGDVDRAARLTARLARPVFDNGRTATVDRWLGRFDDDDLLSRYPAVAANGARFHLWSGHDEDAARWLASVDARRTTGRQARDGEACAATVQAAACRDGVQQMLADAETAVAGLPARSDWLPEALVLRGVARVLTGDVEQADADFATAASSSEALGQIEIRLLALGERAMLAGEGAAWVDDDEDAAPIGFPTAALQQATTARAQLRAGNWDAARARLAKAQQLTPFLGVGLPWLAVQARLEIVRAYVTLRDVAAAQAVLAEIDQLVAQRPDLGLLTGEVEAIRPEVDGIPSVRPGRASGLTGAELRLLPLLATHLSFREIGTKLYVSRNTIKTQAISVYRKLGVSTRSEAVDRATELGLVEDAVVSR
jgi:LuxR family maltose regulon positive regulatory protein